MSDHNLIDEQLVSFDQQQPSPTKAKTNDAFENRLLDDIDPFGNCNGQDNHQNGTNDNKDSNSNQFSLTNDLFPVDLNEHKNVNDTVSLHNNDDSNNSSIHSLSQSSGNVADKNALLLELDPDAPPPVHLTKTDTPSPNDPFKQFSNITSQQDNRIDALLDFGGSNDDDVKQEQHINLASFDNLISDVQQSHNDENLNLSSQSNELQQQLLRQASVEFDNAAQELAEKLDLITTPSPTITSAHEQRPTFDTTELSSVTETQSAAAAATTVTTTKLDSTVSPAKKPASNITRPSSAVKTKPTSATSKSTEHKPAAASASATSKSTEHKPVTTSTTKATEPKPATHPTRKTLHPGPATSATASNKSKLTPTSPTQESSATAVAAPKPTRDAPAKPHSATTKPKLPAASSAASSTTTTTTATTAAVAARSTVKPVTKTARPSTVPKTSDSKTTILSTAPEGSASSTTVPAASTTKPNVRPPQSSTKPPTKAASSTTASSSSHAASSTAASRITATTTKPTVPKQRPTSHTRTTASRPSTATHTSTTAPPKRSSSASRPSTADASTRASRSTAAEGASGTTVVSSKPQWNSTTSKVGSLQNTAHKAGGGAAKIATQKLQWTAKSKIGSLENAHHKPGGGAVKIESKKLDFKEKAKPRTDTGKNETMASGDDASASATVNDEHQNHDEPTNENAKSQNAENGDK
ncbi:unnamed protein product [Rotaria socialis]|uniref:Microtubule-associated protein n=1 Tax=Rotaria socialis TaxID=392032 RepID=A0A821NWI2_9BILA|nr:unnamed protein product [Rotaria socialis]CAF4795660.1 unnamed protein product [Rotaria socialis]